jgi:hypothetical protein
MWSTVVPLSERSDSVSRMLMHATLQVPSRTTIGEVVRGRGLSATHLDKVALTSAAHACL